MNANALLFALCFSPVFAGAWRECPDGYTYAGDDEKTSSSSGRSLYGGGMEVSPVYSCYKAIAMEGGGGGINQAIAACSGDDGVVVTFDNPGEIERFVEISPSVGFAWRELENGTEAAVNFLTSGMYFEDVGEWIYLGTDVSLPANATVAPAPNGTAAANCLSMLVVRALRPSSSFSFGFVSAQCNSFDVAACEVRVQEVTYYDWIFDSAWIGLLLLGLFATVAALAFLYCCILACCCGKRSGGGGGEQGVVVKAELRSDQPPTYSEVVDVVDDNGERIGTFQRIKNKGQQIWGHVYN